MTAPSARRESTQTACGRRAGGTKGGAKSVSRMSASGHTRFVFFFFQAEDGIRDVAVTGVQTCALPIRAAAVVVHPGVLTTTEGELWSRARCRTREPGGVSRPRARATHRDRPPRRGAH